MTRQRKVKRPTNDAPGPIGSGVALQVGGGSRRGSRRDSAGGRVGVASSVKGRERHKRGAKVIPLPRGRLRRPRSFDRRSVRKAVGRGRLRLVVAVVAVVCLS